MPVKGVTLKIDNPCHERWNGMTPTGSGRYCDRCATQVVDFTAFSDEQLVRFFHKQSDIVCGRLNNHQMNRVLEERRLSTGYGVVARIAAGLLIAAPIAGYAQTPASDTPLVAHYQKTGQQSEPAKEIKPMTTDSTRIVIEGKIRFAEDNSPAIGAVAVIEELSTGACADINGNFRFTVPDSLLTDSLELRFVYIGYETIIMPIRRAELIEQRTLVLDVVLKEDESIRLVTVGMIEPNKHYKKETRRTARRNKRAARREKVDKL